MQQKVLVRLKIDNPQKLDRAQIEQIVQQTFGPSAVVRDETTGQEIQVSGPEVVKEIQRPRRTRAKRKSPLDLR